MRMHWFGWVAAGWLTASTRVVAQTPADWAVVAGILGVPGAEVGGYRRFSLPRRDLSVTVGDVAVAPGLALGGWVGFDGTPAQASAMGDLVVTAAELRAVSRRLIDGGLAITAVHNHLAGERPQILYLHFHGHGAAATIVRTLDQALAATGTSGAAGTRGEGCQSSSAPWTCPARIELLSWFVGTGWRLVDIGFPLFFRSSGSSVTWNCKESARVKYLIYKTLFNQLDGTYSRYR